MEEGGEATRDNVANILDRMEWRRRSRGVREDGRIPSCSRTAGVGLKMEPDDPRMMI